MADRARRVRRRKEEENDLFMRLIWHPGLTNMSTDHDELISQAKSVGITRFVVGAVILSNNQILVLKRASRESFLPNLWELPSGKVDQGEDLGTALTREVFEETGLSIGSGRYVDHFDYKSKSGQATRQFNFLITYDVDKAEVKLNAEEHDEYMWTNDFSPCSPQVQEMIKKAILL